MQHKLLRLVCAGALAAAMAVPAMAAPVAINAVPVITVQRAAAGGDSLRFTFSLSGVGTGANAVLCKLGYDKTQLQLKSAALVPGNGQSQTAARSTALKTDTPGVVSAEWHDLDAFYTGGDFLVMEFTALTDLTSTQVTVSDVQLAAMQNGVAVWRSAGSAAVYASGGILPGDLNRDGNPGIGDLVLLSQYVSNAKSPGFYAATAGDLNGDGKLGIGDLVILCRAVEGSLSLPKAESSASCSLG